MHIRFIVSFLEENTTTKDPDFEYDSDYEIIEDQPSEGSVPENKNQLIPHSETVFYFTFHSAGAVCRIHVPI